MAQQDPADGRITTTLRDGMFLIGIDRPAPAPASSRIELMERVARGEIDIDTALQQLEGN